MRTVSLLLALVALAAACTSPTEPPTPATVTTVLTGAPTPDAAVRELFVAIDSEQIGGVEDLVVEDQVALLLALEGASAGEVAAMLDDGVSEPSEQMFWTTFRDTFPRSTGEHLADLIVAEGSVFTVEEVRFATVDVSLRTESGVSHWLVQQVGERWRVDLFATFGSVIAMPLRLWLATLPLGPDTDQIKAAIARQRPSLLATLQRQPLGPMDPGVAQQIRGLLVDVGAGG